MYRYTVDGRGYESRLFSYAGLSYDSDALQRRREAYAVGRRVPAYYDPRKPARAVLERDESIGWIFLALVRALFVVVGLMLS